MAIKLGDAILRFLADFTDANKATKEFEAKAQATAKSASQSFEGFGGAIRRVEGFLRGATAALVAFAIAKVFKEGAAAALEFERAFNRVAALVGSSTPRQRAQLEELRVGIHSLSPELGTAQERAQGLFTALSQGFRGTNALVVTAEAAKLAKLGLIDAAEATGILDDVLDAYALTAAQAANATSLLVVASREGGGTIGELGAALGRVSPAASALGISLPEVAAALTELNRQGFRAGDAAFALRQVLFALLQPSEAAEKALAGAGLSVKQLREEIREKGFVETLNRMAQASKNSAEATTELFGSARALVAILKLTADGGRDYAGVLQQLEKAYKEGRAAQEAFEARSHTLEGRLETLGNTLNDRVIDGFERLKPLFSEFLSFLEEGAKRGSTLELTLGKLGDLVAVVGLAFAGFAKVLNLTLSAAFQFEDWVTRVQISVTEMAAQTFPFLSSQVVVLKQRLIEAQAAHQQFAESAERNNETIEKLFGILGKGPEAGGGTAELQRQFDIILRTTVPTAQQAAGTFGLLGNSVRDFRQEFVATTAMLKSDATPTLKTVQEQLDEFHRSIQAALEAELVPSVHRSAEAFEGLLKLFAPPEIQNLIAAKEAFKTLGLEGIVGLREQVQQLGEALKGLQSLKGTGLVTPLDLVDAEIVFLEKQIELYQSLGLAVEDLKLRLEGLRKEQARLRGDTGAVTQAFQAMSQAFVFGALQGILSAKSFSQAIRQTLKEVIVALARFFAVKAAEELAAGFASLAVHDYRGAALHFKSAALWFVAAAAAGVAARFVGGREDVQRTQPASGQQPGQTQGTAPTPLPTTIVRRFGAGGLVTRPTLALIGEQAPEVVVPLGPSEAGSREQEDGSFGRSPVNVYIEGVISRDNLLDVMREMSRLVNSNDAQLLASSARSVTRRS